MFTILSFLSSARALYVMMRFNMSSNSSSSHFFEIFTQPNASAIILTPNHYYISATQGNSGHTTQRTHVPRSSCFPLYIPMSTPSCSHSILGESHVIEHNIHWPPHFQVVLEEAKIKEAPKLECPSTPTPSVEDIEKRLKVTVPLLFLFITITPLFFIIIFFITVITSSTWLSPPSSSSSSPTSSCFRTFWFC